MEHIGIDVRLEELRLKTMNSIERSVRLKHGLQDQLDKVNIMMVDYEMQLAKIEEMQRMRQNSPS